MKHLFSDKIPVRARDIDIFDHVNNSIYLTYMEETRWHWFQKTGLMQDFKDGLAIVEAKIEFKKPIEYPNDVCIETFVYPPGRSSFTVHHKLSTAKNPQEICTTADIKIVFFDLQTKKAIPIPEKFKKLIS